ncbi:MAG: DUF4465 domain-containing protein [Algibacter sp.]
MKFSPKYILAISCIALFVACDDELELRVPYPNDITFNELSLDRFSYEIPDASFDIGDSKTGVITVNVVNSGNGDYNGFAISNKNFRSFPWNLSRDYAPAGELTPAEVQKSIDSTAFSVYTTDLNRTENYLVGNTKGDNAYFTLAKPGVVEYVLVANTTYNFLLATYGSTYSGSYDLTTRLYKFEDGNPRPNPNVPNTGRTTTYKLPAPGGFFASRLSGHFALWNTAEAEKAGEAARQEALDNGATEEEAQAAYDAAWDERDTNSLPQGEVKLIIEGFLNGNSTGSVDFYLAVLEGVDPLNPDFQFIQNDWRRVDLSSLGEVDKVLFKMTSSYVHANGDMVYPTTFCLDGIRLQ